MAHPFYHSLSSAKKYGGAASDYQSVHDFFDQTKAHLPDVRHRMLLHNSFGIFLCEQTFGVTLKRASDGRSVPTRLIAEQHVIEDLGFIPTLERAFSSMSVEAWMGRGARRLSHELADVEDLPTPLSSPSSGDKKEVRDECEV